METKDLTGNRFGRLVAMEKVCDRIKPSGQRVPIWKCKCDCGNIKNINGYELRSGHTKSCGCLQKERTKNAKTKDMSGMRFGRLTVIKKSRSNSNGIFWICRCDCGKEKEILGASLRRGDVKSCGCLTVEKATKHGLSRSRLRAIWKGMMARCYNKNNVQYKNYGERGICVCDEWKDFLCFHKWACANGYNENSKRGSCTLDRIDVNGNYEPSNCRWVNMKEQENNKRNNVYIEYEGETKTLAQWCEELGLNYQKTQRRIRISKWDIKKAFETK